jgi:hypothetical protein
MGILKNLDNLSFNYLQLGRAVGSTESISTTVSFQKSETLFSLGKKILFFLISCESDAKLLDFQGRIPVKA